MKEYAELSYMKHIDEYCFKTKQGIKWEKVKRRDDIEVLNILASVGWRVISKEDNTYLLEREC